MIAPDLTGEQRKRYYEAANKAVDLAAPAGWASLTRATSWRCAISVCTISGCP
jgi:hypothetical protein